MTLFFNQNMLYSKYRKEINMKVFIIKGKISPTIYDIAGFTDREIKFKGTTKYAVVSSCFYGYDEYSTHNTEKATIEASKKLDIKREAHYIIDNEGNYYRVIDGILKKEKVRKS